MITNKTLYLVEWLTLIQLILLLSAIVGFYILHFVLKIYTYKLNHTLHRIDQLLIELIHEPQKLSNVTVCFFKHNVRELLQCIVRLDATMPVLADWIITKQRLSDLVLKPQARVLSRSRHWLKQYLAVLCYSYGVAAKDMDILSNLVQSNTLLVSLNAAKVIFNHPTAASVNAVIDAFAQGRDVQQSLFAEVLISAHGHFNEELINPVIERLNVDQDPYVKAFCYRILVRSMPLNDIFMKMNAAQALEKL